MFQSRKWSPGSSSRPRTARNNRKESSSGGDPSLHRLTLAHEVSACRAGIERRTATSPGMSRHFADHPSAMWARRCETNTTVRDRTPCALWMSTPSRTPYAPAPYDQASASCACRMAASASAAEAAMKSRIRRAVSSALNSMNRCHTLHYICNFPFGISAASRRAFDYTNQQVVVAVQHQRRTAHPVQESPAGELADCGELLQVGAPARRTGESARTRSPGSGRWRNSPP